MSEALTFAAENEQAGLSSVWVAMLEHAPWPMAMAGGANHIVHCVNLAFCRLLDKPLEELVGKPFGELLPDRDEFVALLDRVYRTGQPEIHREAQPSKATPVFRSYAMWPVAGDDGPTGVIIQVSETGPGHEIMLAMNEALMLGALRQHELTEAADSSNALLQSEISERKQAEAALRLAKAQLTDRAGQLEGLVNERTSELSALNQQLEAFVYSIAHDLRAPLRIMQGYSSMLMEEAGAALSQTGQDCAQRINKSALFLDALLVDLLAFSRISQERLELVSVSLKTIVESVLSRLHMDIQQKHAQVESAGRWPMVLAHQPTLAQVLFNLVSNALKFVAPEVPPRVRLRAEEKGEFVRVWVEDNGLGIAADHQNQVFQIFTRLEGEKYAGTGIGLAIVQKGIERMGGRLGVESAVGQGSRFWFELHRGSLSS
jgi:signal transduction histidine kinase